MFGAAGKGRNASGNDRRPVGLNHFQRPATQQVAISFSYVLVGLMSQSMNSNVGWLCCFFNHIWEKSSEQGQKMSRSLFFFFKKTLIMKKIIALKV